MRPKHHFDGETFTKSIDNMTMDELLSLNIESLCKSEYSKVSM